MNPLHSFDSYSYDIKVTIPPIGALSAPNTPLADGEGITIAHTGRTGQFLIQGLEMETVTPVSIANTESITKMAIEIIEQNGMTFFDKYFASFAAMGWESYTQPIVYVEISFNGWNADGSPSPQSFKNGWRTIVTDIQMTWDGSNCHYTMDVTPMNHLSYMQNSLKTNRQFTSEIKKTYTETIAELQRTMNESLKSFEGSVNTPVGPIDEYRFVVGDRFMEIVGSDDMMIQDAVDVSSFMRAGDGKYYYVYSGCTRIDEALMRLATHIKDIGHKLLPNTQDDNTLDSSATPDSNFSQFFAVTGEVTQGEFNANQNNYQRIFTYTIDIVPRPDMDVQPPNTPGDEGRAQAYESENMVLRDYFYQFTGKNVDVLSIDGLDFNLMYTTIVSAYQRSSYQQSHATSAEGESYENDTDEVLARKKTNSFDQSLPNILGPILGALNSGSYMEELSTGTALTGLLNYRTKAKNSPEATRSGISMADDPQHESNRKLVDEAFARALYCPKQAMITINLNIVGDPVWMSSTDASDPNSGTNYSDGTKMVYLRFKTGEPHDSQTGLPFSLGKINFEGYYKVMGCVSTFRNGMFTQVLNLILDDTTLGVEKNTA